MAVITSYPFSNTNTGAFNYGGYGYSQTFMFTGSTPYRLTSVDMQLSKFGAGATSVVAYIYNATGTYGTNSIKTGSALATSDALPNAAIAESYPTFSTAYSIGFSGSNIIELQPNTVYSLYVVVNGGNGSNALFFGYDNTSSTYGGDLFGEDPGAGGIWSQFPGDLTFVLNGVAVTHATKAQTGKVNVRGNTDRAQSGVISVFDPNAATGGTSQSGGWGTFGLGGLFGGEASQAGETLQSQPQTGRVNIRTLNDQTQTGKLRVQQTTDRNQTGTLRVQQSTTWNQSGQVRVSGEPSRVIQGTVRIQQTYDRNQQGSLRVAVEQTQDQYGKLRVSQLSTKDQTGKLRVQAYPERNQTGKLRVQAILDQAQNGIIRVQATLDKPQTGKLNIIEFYPQEQTGAIRIYNPIIDQGGYIPQWAPVGEIDEADSLESGTVIPKIASEGAFEATTTDGDGEYIPRTIEKGNF